MKPVASYWAKGPYTLNLQALKSQKVSESDYTRIINNLRKKYKNQVSWEVIKQSPKDNLFFGIASN